MADKQYLSQHNMKKGLIILLFFFSLWGKICHGQELIHSKNYSIEHGLDERIVWKIIRDHQGVFWVFNDFSIQEFDGATFFNKIDLPPEFRNSKIDEVHLFPDNMIYIIYNERTSLYALDTDNKKLNKIDIHPEGLYVISDANHQIYFLDKQNTYYSYDPVKEEYTKIASYNLTNKVKKILPYDSTLLLLEENGNLWQCEDQTCIKQLNEVKQIIGIVNNKGWIMKENGIIGKIDSLGKFTPLLTEPYQKATLHKDAQGNSLLAASDDIQRLKHFYFIPNGSITLQPYADIIGNENTTIDYYSEDFTRQIMLATYNGIWYHKINNVIKNYHILPNIPKGIFGHLVVALFYRKYDDKIYFSRETTGLLTLDKKGKIEEHPNKKLNTSLIERKVYNYDDEKDILYAVNGLDSNQMQVYNFKNDQFLDFALPWRPLCINRLSEETIIFAGGKNKAESPRLYDQGRIGTYHIPTQTFNYDFPSISGDVYDIEVLDNHLYLATSKGFQKCTISINNDKEVKLTDPTKITDDKIHYKYFYYKDPYLMVGTYGEGIFVYKSDSLYKHINEEKGLSNNSIASIHYDKKNRVYWIGTFNGITVINQDFDVIQNILIEDGLAENETNSFAFCEDDDGRYYYGTINGITSFFPEDLLNLNSTQKIKLGDLVYYQENGKFTRSVSENQTTLLPYGVDSLELNYHVYDYSRNLRYKYWAYSYDFSSSNPEDRLTIYRNKIATGNLAPGTRTFTIQNRINTNELSPEIKTTVKIPSFYEKYFLPFILTCLFISLLWYIYRLRIKREEERQKHIKSQYENQITKLRLASLRSQMNPHFIFNALGAIQYYVEKNETEIANKYLADFASLMRLILDSSNKEMISLRDEINLINLYLGLEHARFSEKFTYKINTSEVKNFDFNIPVMIIQPFLENAINHGIYHLQDKDGVLTVDFRQVNEETLICIIEDNGIGRKASAKLRKNKHLSRGMKIVRDRINNLQESHSMQVTTEIIDLVENTTAKGTKIVITFTA